MMLSIQVNGKTVLPAKGQQIEFVDENPLFSEAEGYSMTIEFPMIGCPQNIAAFGHIHRADIHKITEYLPCEISHGEFHRTGSLALIEVSESVVRGQFIEGLDPLKRKTLSEATKIRDLDLGCYPYTRAKEVTAATAFNGTASEICNQWIVEGLDVVNNLVDWEYSGGKVTPQWNGETDYISWMPYLLTIVKRIADKAGYSLNISALPSKWEKAIICNALPGTWRVKEYAKALPDWTVKEFFNKLAPFLGGIFEIDETARTIIYKSYYQAVYGAGVIQLETEDNYSAQVDFEDGTNECFIPNRDYRYKRTDNPIWDFYDNPGFVQKHKNQFKTYPDFDTMQKDKATVGADGHRTGGAGNYVYIQDIDTYFVTRHVITGTKNFGKLEEWIIEAYPYMNMYVWQPVNNLGPVRYDSNNELNYTELDVTPVAVDYALEGVVMWLPLKSDESNNRVGEGYEDYAGVTQEQLESNEGVKFSGGWSASRDLLTNSHRGIYVTIDQEDGNKDGAFYDSLLIGFIKKTAEGFYTPYADVQPGMAQGIELMDRPMRLKDAGSIGIGKVDSDVAYTFTFVARKIHDIKNRFQIQGQTFVCSKITYTFDDQGRGILAKGTFYRLIN